MEHGNNRKYHIALVDAYYGTAKSNGHRMKHNGPMGIQYTLRSPGRPRRVTHESTSIFVTIKWLKQHLIASCKHLFIVEVLRRKFLPFLRYDDDLGNIYPVFELFK